MKRLICSLLALAIALFVPPAALATVYTIRGDGTGDFPTIQEAINACITGDVIQLVNGTYRGPGNRDLHYDGKAITVGSISGDPWSCVIDCEGFSRGIRFYAGEPPEAILQGVTIRGGHATNGGAIAISGASPTIRDCVMVGNSAVMGGAIYT
jgi:hypothetical protein